METETKNEKKIRELTEKAVIELLQYPTSDFDQKLLKAQFAKDYFDIEF